MYEKPPTNTSQNTYWHEACKRYSPSDERKDRFQDGVCKRNFRSAQRRDKLQHGACKRNSPPDEGRDRWRLSCRSSVVESLLHPPCCNVSSFSGSGVSLTHPVLVTLSCFWFVRVSVPHRVIESSCRFVRRFGGVHLVLESVLSFGGWGVSLTGPVLETVWSFFRGLSLIHI